MLLQTASVKSSKCRLSMCVIIGDSLKGLGLVRGLVAAGLLAASEDTLQNGQSPLLLIF